METGSITLYSSFVSGFQANLPNKLSLRETKDSSNDFLNVDGEALTMINSSLVSFRKLSAAETP